VIRKATIAAFVTGAALSAAAWMTSPRGIQITDQTDYGIGQGAFYFIRLPVGVLADTMWIDVRNWSLPTIASMPFGSGTVRFIVVPLWIPLVLFAMYPTIAFIRGPARRWRRRRAGLCIRCGYDLTGNVTGVCSECGRPE
jgi:hypothetical protein